MDTQLTPAELDGLLEAGTWRAEFPTADGYYWYRWNNQEAIYYIFGGKVWGVLSGDVMHPPLINAEWLGPVEPATVTRLVLMVRELQRDNEKWQRAAGYWKAQHESEDNSHRLTIATFRRQEEIWQQKNLEADTAVEHFRARAVRAIKATRGSSLWNANGYDTALSSLIQRIESLPLVETEERDVDN